MNGLLRQQQQQRQPAFISDDVISAQSLHGSDQADTAEEVQLAQQQQHVSGDDAIKAPFFQQTSAVQHAVAADIDSGDASAFQRSFARVQGGSVMVEKAGKSAAKQMGSKAVICKALSPTRPAVPPLSLAAMHDSTRAASSARGSRRRVGVFRE